MTDLVIEKGIVIDDVESVLGVIRDLSGTYISSLEVVKKFVNNEENTKFYIDNNLNSSTQKSASSVYLWLDSGFVDRGGKPIMISLLKSNGAFAGHVVGTVNVLADSARCFFKIKRNIANQKMVQFKKKYDEKTQKRGCRHISDEQKYILDSCNDAPEVTVMGSKILALGLTFEESEEEPVVEEVVEVEEPGMSEIQEEITISILWDKIEEMKTYMDELVGMLENVTQESNVRIQELQAKNEEYKRALIDIRTFTQTGEISTKQNIHRQQNPGHDLLGRRGKILVVGGTGVGENVMYGIAKAYGFEKKDFDFISYDEAKTYMDRIRREGRYNAIIMGAVPHKTKATGAYSSVVEMFRRTEGMPFMVDARSKNGKLKVTKESFREAILAVCANLQNLQNAYAC